MNTTGTNVTPGPGWTLHESWRGPITVHHVMYRNGGTIRAVIIHGVTRTYTLSFVRDGVPITRTHHYYPDGTPKRTVEITPAGVTGG